MNSNLLTEVDYDPTTRGENSRRANEFSRGSIKWIPLRTLVQQICLDMQAQVVTCVAVLLYMKEAVKSMISGVKQQPCEQQVTLFSVRLVQGYRSGINSK